MNKIIMFKIMLISTPIPLIFSSTFERPSLPPTVCKQTQEILLFQTGNAESGAIDDTPKTLRIRSKVTRNDYMSDIKKNRLRKKTAFTRDSLCLSNLNSSMYRHLQYTHART